jgi:hypothetical protein
MTQPAFSLTRGNSAVARLTMWELGMQVIDCDIPPGSALGRDLIENAYFHDSYFAPLARPELGIVDIYTAILGHTPLTLKLLLIARNAIVRPFGLKAPTAAEIMRSGFRTGHAVGDTIGRWRIFFISEDEIIAGADDKHQDFRVSVLRARHLETAGVVMTTICTVHNLFGKLYLFFVVPFHRYAVRKLLSNAVAAKRL